MALTYKLTQEEQETHEANLKKLEEIIESGVYDNSHLIPIKDRFLNNSYGVITNIKERDDNTISVSYSCGNMHFTSGGIKRLN